MDRELGNLMSWLKPSRRWFQKDFWLISSGVRVAPRSWELVVVSYSADQEAGRARVIGGPEWVTVAVHVDLGYKNFH